MFSPQFVAGTYWRQCRHSTKDKITLLVLLLVAFDRLSHQEGLETKLPKSATLVWLSCRCLTLIMVMNVLYM